MEIKLPFDVEAIQNAALKTAHNEINRSIGNAVFGLVSEMFATQQYDYQKRLIRAEGYIRTVIRERIETYVTSPEFEQKIQETIERHIDQASEDAVKKMLESASRKRVFTAVPHKSDVP